MLKITTDGRLPKPGSYCHLHRVTRIEAAPADTTVLRCLGLWLEPPWMGTHLTTDLRSILLTVDSCFSKESLEKMTTKNRRKGLLLCMEDDQQLKILRTTANFKLVQLSVGLTFHIQFDILSNQVLFILFCLLAFPYEVPAPFKWKHLKAEYT